MNIALGCDHRGYALKQKLGEFLEKAGYKVEDMGSFSEDKVDYPDIAFKVARAVSEGSHERGILICGSGIGMSIAANKVKGIRAALVFNEDMARLSYEHNKAQIICLSSDFINIDQAVTMVKAWLGACFSAGRHERRIETIDKYINNI